MRMLEGFTTDPSRIVRHFQHEIDMCRSAVDACWTSTCPDAIHAHLQGCFERHGMAESFQKALAEIMATPTLECY